MNKSKDVILLNSIQQTLEDIKSLLVLLNQDKIQDIKNNILKQGTMKTQIYELCDGTRTTSDIVAQTKKTAQYVGSYISILRREGLIRTVEKEGKQVHEQVF